MQIRKDNRNSIYHSVSKKGIAYLSKSSKEDFQSAQDLPTVFQAFMVLSSIRGISELEKLTSDLKVFLLSETHPVHKTINWWQRKSSNFEKEPYPDDLDDTFCTWSALFQTYKDSVTPNILAKLTQVLIHCESKEGGPYTTWLVPNEHEHTVLWKDIDPVVNCNIAYFLSLQGIFLPNVISYLSKTFAKEFESKYYPSIFPVLYFFSRFYEQYEVYTNAKHLKNVLKGTAKRALKALLSQYTLNKCFGNSQDTALAVNTILSLDTSMVSSDFVLVCLDTLARNQLHGSWESERLCIHTNKHGVMKTVGSKMITTALCFEAFQKFETLCEKEHKQSIGDNSPSSYFVSLETTKEILEQSFRGATKQVLLEKLNALSHSDNFRITTQFATLCYKSFPLKYKDDTLNHISMLLGCASMLGWVAYSLMDDVLDRDIEKNEGMPLVQRVQLLAVQTYRQCVGDTPWFWDKLDRFKKEMDEALEASHNNMRKTMETLEEQSWKKSLGCMLGVYAMLSFLPESEREEKANILLSFFKHFIATRQLSDDAHDWKADLIAKHETLVTLLLKKDTKTGNTDYETVFWTKTIFTVCSRMENHVSLCKKALSNLKPSYRISWMEILMPTEHLIQKTQLDALNMIDFLSSYSKHGMLNTSNERTEPTSTN
jgi:hypothetical protein